MLSRFTVAQLLLEDACKLRIVHILTDDDNTTIHLQYTYETLRDTTPTVLDMSPTRHFAYYLDSSPADGSFCQQDSQNKIKCVGLI